MEILSKNLLIQQAIQSQNAWLIKIELKKNINYSHARYNQLIVPELTKFYKEDILSEIELRLLYTEDFIIKKFEKYKDAFIVWQNIPKYDATINNKIINEYFIIYCSLLNKEGLEVKNNKN